MSWLVQLTAPTGTFSNCLFLKKGRWSKKNILMTLMHGLPPTWLFQEVLPLLLSLPLTITMHVVTQNQTKVQPSLEQPSEDHLSFTLRSGLQFFLILMLVNCPGELRCNLDHDLEREKRFLILLIIPNNGRQVWPNNQTSCHVNHKMESWNPTSLIIFVIILPCGEAYFCSSNFKKWCKIIVKSVNSTLVGY